jgi:hypothetical protein
MTSGGSVVSIGDVELRCCAVAGCLARCAASATRPLHHVVGILEVTRRRELHARPKPAFLVVGQARAGVLDHCDLRGAAR